MAVSLEERKRNEIAHTEMLLRTGYAKDIYHYGTPAGVRRAERRAALVDAKAGLTAGRTGVEIGCGEADYTKYFRRSGARVIATDLSAAVLLKAKEIYAVEDLMACDTDFLPFSSNAVEAVIGNAILHHLEMDVSVPEIFRVLKPGGRFAFAEPNMLNPLTAVQKCFPSLREKFFNSPDETAFFRGQLRRCFVRHGFEDVHCIHIDFLHPSIPKRLVGFFDGVGRRLEKTPFLRLFSGSLLVWGRKPLG